MRPGEHRDRAVTRTGRGRGATDSDESDRPTENPSAENPPVGHLTHAAPSLRHSGPHWHDSDSHGAARPQPGRAAGGPMYELPVPLAASDTLAVIARVGSQSTSDCQPEWSSLVDSDTQAPSLGASSRTAGDEGLGRLPVRPAAPDRAAGGVAARWPGPGARPAGGRAAAAMPALPRAASRTAGGPGGIA